MKNILYSLIIISIFQSCENKKCDYNSDKWISDAPLALKDFHGVKKEIIANKSFVKDYTHKGFIFLSAKDTTKIKEYESLHLLLKWFRNGRGYINIDSTDENFAFKECRYSGNSASGYVYHNLRGKFNHHVTIIDSADLGDSWFAYVVKCSECDD